MVCHTDETEYDVTILWKVSRCHWIHTERFSRKEDTQTSV